jgi:hypothetical protein
MCTSKVYLNFGNTMLVSEIEIPKIGRNSAGNGIIKFISNYTLLCCYFHLFLVKLKYKKCEMNVVNSAFGNLPEFLEKKKFFLFIPFSGFFKN